MSCKLSSLTSERFVNGVSSTIFLLFLVRVVRTESPPFTATFFQPACVVDAITDVRADARFLRVAAVFLRLELLRIGEIGAFMEVMVIPLTVLCNPGLKTNEYALRLEDEFPFLPLRLDDEFMSFMLLEPDEFKISY